MRPERKSLVNIQILRGFAAVSVVGKHAADQFPNIPSLPRINALQSGVDVFFVISGFIMVYVTVTRPQTSGNFLLNRVARIAPTYWFYTLLTALLAIAIPSVFRGTTFGAEHLILSLLFIAHVNPATHSTSPLFRLGWTLNYEMFFYVLFALSLLLRTPSAFKRLSLAIVAITALVLLGFAVHPSNPVFQFYTRDIMLEFAFGMILAGLYFNGLPSTSKLLAFILVLIAVTSIFAASNRVDASPIFRSVYFGIPALLIVAAALVLESNQTGRFVALLRSVGDASFTIYLSHPFSTSLFRAILTRTHFAPDSLVTNMLFIVLTVAFAAFVGVWAYRFIELPLVTLSRRALRSTSAF